MIRYLLEPFTQLTARDAWITVLLLLPAITPVVVAMVPERVKAWLKRKLNPKRD